MIVLTFLESPKQEILQTDLKQFFLQSLTAKVYSFPPFMPSFILTFHTFRDCRYSIQLQTEVAGGQIQTEPASKVQPSIIMKYSNFAEPPFRQKHLVKTGDVNVLCSWLRRVCRSWKQGQRTSTLLTSSESRWLLCVSHLSTVQSPFFSSNILGMAFLVFLQWIQWMAGWVGVHSKGYHAAGCHLWRR